ncbi:MAG: HAD-IA family hydrolase [Synergistaceae bacterium]|jgi:phosphoglycolate phosphatase-like HAD superfamily hydrolase|nr:HAD-IA family hydrolase [Synergistaceae bacterium]
MPRNTPRNSEVAVMGLERVQAAIRHPAQAGAFILDWDGVLADTRLDFKPLRQKYFGDSAVAGLGMLEAASTFPDPLREEAMAEIRGIEMEGAERATAVDGAKDLIAWLAGGGTVADKPRKPRPWAVVSRNCRDSIVLAAERCGIALPSVLLSREDPYVKPDPKALALAAERLGVNLSDCVMVGDFVYDLQAARSAAIPSVLVRSGGAEWERLADFTYATVKDFVEALDAFDPT